MAQHQSPRREVPSSSKPSSLQCNSTKKMKHTGKTNSMGRRCHQKNHQEREQETTRRSHPQSIEIRGLPRSHTPAESRKQARPAQSSNSFEPVCAACVSE
eukprot:3014569-Amphidinium_carterae.1